MYRGFSRGQGFGGIVLADSVTSSGKKTAVPAAGADWSLQVIHSGSTSAITCSVVLQGTLDLDSAAPTYANLLTWSSTQSSGDIVYQAGRPAGKVRADVVSISSTSTAATPTCSVYAAAVQ